MGNDLGCSNNINMERGKSCKVTSMIKGSERRPFVFIFRLNIQANEIVLEIEEWKQKFPDEYLKSFGRFLLGVLETSIVS